MNNEEEDEEEQQDFDLNQNQEIQQDQDEAQQQIEQQESFKEQQIGQQDEENKQDVEVEDQISYELEEKYKVLENFLEGKNEEQILNVRMHQLAVAKILVFTHERSPNYLVQAHSNLGQAYLNFKCFEQAIDHLTIALKKNGKLFAEIPSSKDYHAQILKLLGKCYLEIGSSEEALELLNKAYEIQKQLYEENNINFTETLTLIASCNRKMKQYDIALENIEKVINIQIQVNGQKSQSVALSQLELAKVFALKEDYNQAIQYQTQGIGKHFLYNFKFNKEQLTDLEFNKPDFIAEQFLILAELYQKNNDLVNQINNLHQVKTIYSQLYGQNDKKVIKIKRQISINLLKAEQHEEALKELLETEDMEIKYYGDNSLQVAKTWKIIGTILILIKQISEAQKYLMKAQKVFEEHGLKKAIAEIKQKLGMIKTMKEKEKTNQ